MTTKTNLSDCWAPIFWEPVDGTGERLTIGAVVRFSGTVSAHRFLRDDVLDSLFGKSANNVRNLMDSALNMIRIIAEHDFNSIKKPMSGFEVGEPRFTQPKSVNDALRSAALLYSSLANLDKIDDLDAEDAPPQEEVNRRFSTEVRESVLQINPTFDRWFNRQAVLIDGGEPVKFGFLSDHVVLHFGVLHPVRMGSSVKDARSRLWELARARDFGSKKTAALVMAVPNESDPTLGMKQRDGIKRYLNEIEREADITEMRLYPVTTVKAGADKVIELA